MIPDAAKRRQLPAWIREGLEKMEREKQKKIDRERQIKEREEYLQKKREEEENAINELEKTSGQPAIPKKSKFVSILVWCTLLFVCILVLCLFCLISLHFFFLGFLSLLRTFQLMSSVILLYFGFQSKKHCWLLVSRFSSSC
jgi:Flp pilus assembly protein TadB